MQYFFILGKNPILSKAEIDSVLKLESIKYKSLEFKGNVLVIETEKVLDIEWLNKHLGGTVKIGRILDKIKTLEGFESKFFKLIKFGKGKIHFGFSLYLLDNSLHLKKYLKELKPLAMDIKRKLREEKNVNSRWVSSKEPELSSVIVKKNQLLKYGSEICFFIKDKPSFAKASESREILVGQTLAVQQFEEFGARDYARPGRDSVSGMLPPKLARIMINLAQLKPESKILDPFCGSGTVLQEALILSYKNLIGTDNSAKAIADTKKNLEWLGEKYDIKNVRCEIFQLDVKDLSNKTKQNSIDAIITEPYLGPPLSGRESQEKIKQIVKDLEKLYIDAFSQFYKVLTKGGKVVCIFPIFKINNLKLDILPQLRGMGYKLLNTDDLIYFRSQQFVCRDILIFEK